MPKFFACGCLALVGLVLPVAGYNPPIDKAGPLTVRIDGPAAIIRSGSPVAVAVSLDNALRIAREDSGVVLTPLPGGGPFEIRLRVDTVPGAVEALDESRRAVQSAPARVENGILVITRDPAIFAYWLRP